MPELMPDINVLLLDIEGTTAPIDFVYNTLFPYARANMAAFLAEKFDEADRDLLEQEYAGESASDKPAWTAPPVNYLLWLMDQDRKSRGLKSVQGKIWDKGYRDGTLRGEVYPDVAPVLRQWKQANKRIFTYSSGSVQAQRLLFGHSTDGDLTTLIDGYFDTEIGPKRSAESYKSIAGRIGEQANRCLFISDIAAECEVASEADFNTLLCVRPGNAPQAGDFATISRFDEIFSLVAAFGR